MKFHSTAQRTKDPLAAGQRAVIIGRVKRCAFNQIETQPQMNP